MNKFNFGPYKDQTFDQIASTQEGLLYLDSMREIIKGYVTFYNDIMEYVSNPEIAQKIEEAIDNKKEK